MFEIQTSHRLVIKALIPYQRIILIQKLKLLNEITRYNLYYSLICYVLIEIYIIINFIVYIIN